MNSRVALSSMLLLCIVAMQIDIIEMKECYECDPKANNDCLDVSTTSQCETETCYTKIGSDGRIKRGCGACQEGEKESCKDCNDDKCNKHQICKKCKSSDDKTCLNALEDLPKFNTICESDIEQCLNEILDGHLERRCATKDQKCGNTKTCSLCTGANCNKAIFPAGRRQCYQCTNSDNECHDTQKISSKICSTYDEKDVCYMYGVNETQIWRGCISDKASLPNECEKSNENEKCKTCSGDNCNNMEYSITPKLKCYTCNSDNSNCQKEVGEGIEVMNCKNIIYYQESKCYVEKRDTKYYRGCLLERPTDLGECKEESHCYTCGEEGCNSSYKAEDEEFTCIQCRSDIDPKCYNDADQIPGKDCRTAVTKEKCFYGKWNGVIIRGCLDDADERTKYVCQEEGNKQCHACEGKDCNHNKGGSGSLTVSFATLLLSSMLLAITKY